MAYKVTISDGTILEKSIEFVTFNAYPPPDNFYDMRDFTINSMTINGKISAGENTIGLYKWALLPANNPDCYKEIEVEHTHAGQVVRKVKFPKAFVVDYSENYSKGAGVGYFTIFIRQLAGVDIELTNKVTQQENTAEAEPDLEKTNESVLPLVQGIGVSSADKIDKKPGISVTDMLAVKKKMQDNDYVEAPKVEAKFTLNGNVYKNVNPTARNPRPVIGEPIEGLSAINNNTKDAHAEIFAMNQALKEGNKGGKAELEVKGQPICKYCKSDIKKMAAKLKLDELNVTDETGTYKFIGEKDFKNITDGGKKWGDALL